MGIKGGRKWKLSDAYRFDGFYPRENEVRGIFGKPNALVLPLNRRSKKHLVVSAARYATAGMTEKHELCETFLPGISRSIWKLNSGVLTAGNVAK